MSFIDRVCNGYAAIVKYFSLILSTVFLIVTIILFCDAITLPHHAEFKPSYVAKDFVADKAKLTDNIWVGNLINTQCPNGEIDPGIEKSYIYDLIKGDFNGAGDSEKKTQQMKIAATCLWKMYNIYDVQDFNQWYEYNSAVKENISDKYLNISLALQTMKQFQRVRAEHDAAERDLSWNYYQMGIAGGFFMAFVMSSLLLLLVRIESNTRRRID